MKDIPADKLNFYTKQHQSLRDSRDQLFSVISNSKVCLSSLSLLEQEIVKEAVKNIAKQGKEILVAFDPEIYAQDLERMKAGDDKVYLLCDKEGNLQDMNPLLPFISLEKRREYEALRSEYLGGD